MTPGQLNGINEIINVSIYTKTIDYNLYFLRRKKIYPSFLLLMSASTLNLFWVDFSPRVVGLLC